MAIDFWPEEVFDDSPHLIVGRAGSLNRAVYDAQVLLDWIERQKIRLVADGTTWTEWCNEKGITEWHRKRVARGGLISYALADSILTPAGLMPEDLYGYG